jgi:VWFA-related protein
LAAVTAAVAALSTLLVAGQGQQEPAPPVFRSDIDVVRLDVTVVDKERRPVRDLTADDFLVTEDGRPQRIVAVTEIRASEDPPLTARMRFIPRDIAANDMVDRLGDGRVFVLLLDDFNIPFDDERIVRETRQMARYVVDGMGPSDVAAVVFTAYVGNTIDFTDDRTKLLDAINRFDPPKRDGFVPATPQGMGPTEGDIVQRWAPSLVRSQCFRSQPLAPTIETVTRRLSSIPNRRKTVVLMTTGVPLTVGETRGCSGELAGAIREAFRVAARANINVYPVDPAGVKGYEEYLQHPMRNMKGIFFPRAMDMGGASIVGRQHRDFMKTVAENTGGRAVVATDNIEGEIDRMYAEDGSYYLLGYQSSNTRADGKFREIKVTVKERSGLEVRARSGYFAPREGELARADRDPRASSNELLLSGLGSPIGVTLRVAATALAPAGPPPNRNATVAFVLTLGYPASAGSITERLTVTRNVYDVDGNAGTPVQDRHTLELAPAGIDGQRKHIYYALPLPPGRRQVRFEVRSSALDRSNSIVADVEVPDFGRSRMAVSNVVIGTGVTSGTPAEAAFGSLLPVIPTTERDFASGETPTAFVRIVQGSAATRVPVRVRTEITDGRDATVFEHVQEIAADAFTAEGVPVQTPLSFQKLERGPHVLSMTVEAPGVPAVRRDVLFRIR